jgi:hypothetical protein
LADEDRISSSLQESLLTALCFDNDEINLILPIISPELFEGVYHDISRRVLDYRTRFERAPGKSHIDDLFDDILLDKTHKSYQTYNRLIVGMLEQFENGFDVSYVVSRTSDFVRRQQLKAGVLAAADRYSQGGDNVATDVERILLDAVNKHVKSLDLGTFLGDTQRALRFLDKDTSEYCKTGIKELDVNGIYPVKKQILLFLAPYKRGKSFWLTYIGKMALLQGWKVAEATLEMSEELKTERYIQALYSVSRRKESFKRASFKKDELNRLIDLEVEDHVAKMAFQDPSTRTRLEKRMSTWQNKLNNLVVKEFPTGSLTVQELTLWLDSLEYSQGFVPDLLMVDYPALMSLGEARYHRINLGRILVDLRGLAVKRNMAVVVPQQVNREGARASRVRAIHAAEDISLIATCDTAITYSQTDAEHKMGLARLYVDRARSEKDRFTVLISQSYSSGQFVLESCMMNDKYDSLVQSHASQVQDDDAVEAEEEEDD